MILYTVIYSVSQKHISLHCLLSESFQVENMHPKGVIQILTLDVLTKKFSLIFFFFVLFFLCLFFLCFIKCLSTIIKAKSTHNVFLIIIIIIMILIM